MVTGRLCEEFMWAVLCTDGQMGLNEVRNECISGKWVPIFVFRIDPKDKPIVPLFKSGAITKQFAKRNLPKNWMRGGVELTDREIEWMKEHGWEIKEMDFPHKMDKYICGFEILEFEDSPGFRTSR